jgi:hypothetical protein
MIQICKGQSTRTTITQTDSLRRLLPKGFVVMTEAGARLALQNKVNAESYLSQFTESQKVVAYQDSTIVELTNDNAATKAENKKLKRQNFWKDVKIWGYRIFIVAGSGYVIFKK